MYTLYSDSQLTKAEAVWVNVMEIDLFLVRSSCIGPNGNKYCGFVVVSESVLAMFV